MIGFREHRIASIARVWPGGWIGLLMLGGAFGLGEFPLSAALPAPSSAVRCEIVGPLESSWQEGAMVLNWSTARELGVVGFDLMKRDRFLDSWTAVNPALIAASNSPAGASYTMPLTPDPAVTSSEWTVRVWTEDAQFTDHVLPLRPSADPEASRMRRTPGAIAGAASAGTRIQRMGLPAGGALGAVASVDVLTRNAGVQFLGFAELAAAFQLPVEEILGWADRGQLSLRQQGVRVPGWGDGMNAGWYFHAPRLESLYFAGNVTQVCFEETPLRMAVEVVPGGLVPERSHGQGRLTLERNLQAVPTLPGEAQADFWVWDSFLGGHPTFGARSYMFDLQELAQTEGYVGVDVELATVSSVPHAFVVLLNGRELGRRSWSGPSRRILRFDAAPTWLQATGNTLRIVSNGDRVSLGYLDRFGLDYPRRLEVGSGPLRFSATESRVLEVAGPAGSVVEVWDVTNPSRPVRFERTDVSVGAETFRFQGLPSREYVAFLRGAAMPVERLQAFGLDTLRAAGNRAEYLVIAPESLVTAAGALASRRTAQGLASQVIPLSEIHHAFAFGIPTPTALSRFVSHAHSTWAVPPRYLVVVGDGTYDYRGYLGQSDNLVPPLVISTLFGRVVTDERFGDTDGDGRPEVAVGRLPVHNEAELVRLIGQMDEFESRVVASPRALVLADRPDESGEFIRNAQGLVALLEKGFQVETILNDALETAVVRDQLFQQLASGVQLFNYVGHGGRDRFGAAYLTISDVAALDFGSQQPFVVAMTCAAGQFGLPGTSCLGEALLFKSGRAPIAVWAPSGFSIDLQAHPLNRLLVEELARQPFGTRLGDTLRRVVTAFRDQGGDEVSPGLYSLLGDPTVALQFGLRPATLTLRWAGDQVELQLRGTPGATYQLTASERLDGEDWMVVGELTTDASGEGRFEVVPSAEVGQRFLRAESHR